MGKPVAVPHEFGVFFNVLFFPMWFVFNSVPVPIGMFGDGLFWGLGIVATWHFFSVISDRLFKRG